MAKISAHIIEISQRELTHKHDYAQVVIPLGSSAFIQSEEADYIVDSSTLIYIPPNCSHKYRGDQGNTSLVLNIRDEFIKNTDMGKLGAFIHMFRDDKLSKLIDVILMEIEDNPDSMSLKYLFFFLYDKIVESKTSASLEYIAKHYEDQIPITKLAEIEHYNVNYYREWFKKQTGMRPKDYIQKLRIEKAKELLLTTKYSLSEIASQVGYDHSSSFSRAFKLLEGLSPNVYRRGSD